MQNIVLSAGRAGRLLLSEAETYQRIFGLDVQLLHDTLWTALAIFILFFALSYLLFNPARKLLEERRKRIEKDRFDAANALSEANALKLEYDEKMADVKKKSAEILDDARHRALRSQNEIIDEAKEEAVRIRRRAESEIELERQHARDQVKNEMVDLAAMLAGKVVSANMNTDIQDSLIEETLQEIKESTWRDQ